MPHKLSIISKKQESYGNNTEMWLNYLKGQGFDYAWLGNCHNNGLIVDYVVKNTVAYRIGKGRGIKYMNKGTFLAYVSNGSLVCLTDNPKVVPHSKGTKNQSLDCTNE